jgi:spermidine synthase
MNLRPRPALILPLFFLSGAAGLGYQMIWMRMFAAGLGHEVPAMIAVAGAFLGGMAAGAWALDRRILNSRASARWYGGLELSIGGWGIVTAIVIPLVNQLALTLTGPMPSPLWQWAVVFALPFIALLPATAAMGATLPAMDRLLAPLSRDERSIGLLYAANTFGAVTGTLGSVFVLMPALGFRSSLLCLAVVNIACGLIALVMPREVDQLREVRPSRRATGGKATARESSSNSVEPGARRPAEQSNVVATIPFWRLGLTLFVTGFLGIGFEIVGVRVLLQVLENTIYTYAAALGVFLVGTAAGAAGYQRFGRRPPFAATLTFLLCGVAAACFLGTWLLTASPAFYDACRSALGDSVGAVLASEMAVASMVFGLPTVFMGATFSHLVQGSRDHFRSVGRAGALNTLGCALAAGVFGVILLPSLGTKWSFVLIILGYLALFPRLKGWWWTGVLFTIAALFGMPPTLVLVELPPGAKLRDYREGAMASVAVVETPDGHRSLRVNNRLQMGGTAAATAERRQAHLPLLLHPNPGSALFLGPGTGITLGAAEAYPGLKCVGVELIPEVRDVMPAFEPENGGPFPKPGMRLIVADARRFVRTTSNRYDVIVADLFHPGHDGAGFLYTREHFEAVRSRLKPGGLFCQWLPLHQLDEAGLASIVRTFLDTFSQTHAFLLHFNVDIPVLALIGTPDPLHLAPDRFEERTKNPELRAALREAGLERVLNLLGCLAAGPESLRQFAGEASVGTDDHPVILFRAPRFTSRRETQPHQLLLTFLERCRADPEKFVNGVPGGGDEGVANNLRAFIAARDTYLRGLVEEGAGRLPAAIDAYLQSARESLYFTPAYARCVTIIQVMAQADREGARRLFQRLEEAQPGQPLGRKILGPLFEKESSATQP